MPPSFDLFFFSHHALFFFVIFGPSRYAFVFDSSWVHPSDCDRLRNATLVDAHAARRNDRPNLISVNLASSSAFVASSSFVLLLFFFSRIDVDTPVARVPIQVGTFTPSSPTTTSSTSTSSSTSTFFCFSLPVPTPLRFRRTLRRSALFLTFSHLGSSEDSTSDRPPTTHHPPPTTHLVF